MDPNVKFALLQQAYMARVEELVASRILWQTRVGPKSVVQRIHVLWYCGIVVG